MTITTKIPKDSVGKRNLAYETVVNHFTKLGMYPRTELRPIKEVAESSVKNESVSVGMSISTDIEFNNWVNFFYSLQFYKALKPVEEYPISLILKSTQEVFVNEFNSGMVLKALVKEGAIKVIRSAKTITPEEQTTESIVKAKKPRKKKTDDDEWSI